MAKDQGLSRRQLLKAATALGLSTAALGLRPAWASPLGVSNSYPNGVESGNRINLAVRRETKRIAGRHGKPIAINGSSPGPLIRLREGQDACLKVTNLLDEETSLHWHGLILPPEMDGVPGVSFAGIAPGEAFTARFPVKQNGSYWYHSHSGLQEQLGAAGPLIIDSAEPEPFHYDREHVLFLTDWTFEDPQSVARHLKVAEGYYNHQQRTLADFFDDVAAHGIADTAIQRGMWERMRMSSRDIADVTGSTYTYLVNGCAPIDNWTGLFKTGEKIRLRIINGSAMTYFDVRIPGLKMTVVAADGQPVQPVDVDEFRIAVAEAYDVIVEPETQGYTIFAEPMDRSSYARATLAPELGMVGSLPDRRQIADRGMEAMGHGAMKGMKMSGMEGMAGMAAGAATAGMDKGGMKPMGDMKGMKGMASSGMHASMTQKSATGLLPMGMAQPGSRYDQPGLGLDPSVRRVLVYSDLKARAPWPDRRQPGREIELHLTGNMERYMWSFDGKKFSEVDGPIHFKTGERLRLILVNDTMMEHPIHLHGMWMELENGAGELIPRKHTLNVKPGERVSAVISADAPGSWAFHCHLLYHMHAGMFRVVQVS